MFIMSPVAFYSYIKMSFGLQLRNTSVLEPLSQWKASFWIVPHTLIEILKSRPDSTAVCGHGCCSSQILSSQVQDKFNKKIPPGSKCLFVNKMFWLRASDEDFLSTPVPQDFLLKDALYQRIDWQTLARSTRQRWHFLHEVEPTSAPELHRVRAQKRGVFYQKRRLQEERNPSLCFSI